MTISSRSVPRDLLPAHHFTRTCAGCVRLPLNGVDSKPANDDGAVVWCSNARRIALDQEIERHELDRASAIAYPDVLASFPRPTGSRGRYRSKDFALANDARGRLRARQVKHAKFRAGARPLDLRAAFANSQFRVTTK